jgi:phosphoribosyl 1,2-cyclic phosphodiesterase
VVTDIGHVTEEVSQAVTGADLVLMETNYEEDWLLSGPYPYPLKQRILGDRGHLSNEDGAALACHLAASGTRRLILGHLSKENNSPERALSTVCARLEQQGFRCGVDLQVEVAPRSGCSPVWQV